VRHQARCHTTEGSASCSCQRFLTLDIQQRSTYPFERIQIQIFNLAVVEIGRQTNAVVGHMWLLADDGDIVFTAAIVELEKFLAIQVFSSCVS
jgi:hypothetical protein